VDRIKTGCKSIDDMLNGGVERGSITEIYGEGGSGKTNLCLSMAIETAKSGNFVIYVDTEGVSMERFSQMGGNDEIAKKILFYRVYKFSQQVEVVERISKLVESREDIALIIVDSMTEFYRAEMGVEEEINTRKRRGLAWQLSILNTLARKRNIGVVITNQVYLDMKSREIKPIGGHALQHAAKTIIFLRRVGNGVREAVLIKHRSLPEGRVARFVIAESGLIPFEEKDK